MNDIDTSDPRAVLRAAADYLAEHGWTQGGYYVDVDGLPAINYTASIPQGCAACAMGAIRIVTETHRDLATENNDAYELVIDELKAGGWPAWTSIDIWNDAPGRTADEVIDVLRAAGSES